MSFLHNHFWLFVSASPVLASSLTPGIENFSRVDEQVYRGAQPTDEGFKYLAKMGVQTVIDLREAGGRSKAEEKIVAADGMKYVNVPMTGLKAPTEEQIRKILAILESASAGVFVHCRRGADRTGAVIASYRIDYDHWDQTRALQEAMARGMSFFQLPRQSYIRGFQPRTVEAKTASANNAAAADSPVEPTTTVAHHAIAIPALVP